MSANPELIKAYLKSLLKALDAKAAEPCRRLDGTFRAFFTSKDEAENWAETHENYFGDIAHLCQHCGYWHLSRPQWLEAEKWTN